MENKIVTVSLLILVVFIMIGGFIFLNNKINDKIPDDQYLTQNDWLEVYTAHKIHEAIDNTPRKVVIDSNVESNKISILLRSSTGQEPIPESGRLTYIKDVEGVIKNILEKYNLGNTYTFSVDYIPDLF